MAEKPNAFDTMMGSGELSLAGALHAITHRVEDRCAACGSRLSGVVKAAIHPRTAVEAFPGWEYMGAVQYSVEGVTVPLYAREFVSPGKVSVTCMNGYIIEFPFSVSATLQEGMPASGAIVSVGGPTIGGCAGEGFGDEGFGDAGDGCPCPP